MVSKFGDGARTTAGRDWRQFGLRPRILRILRGFTLIELLVVFTIIALLLTLAMPRYFGSIDKSKEAVLRENLNQMRDAISRYYADKGKYPDSLDTLANDKYLRAVPLDPITESEKTWIVIAPQDPQKGGVYDVKSGAQGKTKDGREFSEL